MQSVVLFATLGISHPKVISNLNCSRSLVADLPLISIESAYSSFSTLPFYQRFAPDTQLNKNLMHIQYKAMGMTYSVIPRKYIDIFFIFLVSVLLEITLFAGLFVSIHV